MAIVIFFAYPLMTHRASGPADPRKPGCVFP
jgi:hypothetical protein